MSDETPAFSLTFTDPELEKPAEATETLEQRLVRLENANLELVQRCNVLEKLLKDERSVRAQLHERRSEMRTRLSELVKENEQLRGRIADLERKPAS